MCKLASVARHQSLGRAGLMSLSECIFAASESSTVSATPADNMFEGENCMDTSFVTNGVELPLTEPSADEGHLIDSLRFLVENSKQHFNPNYRLKGCDISCC